jgi:hypothetical protein
MKTLYVAILLNIPNIYINGYGGKTMTKRAKNKRREKQAERQRKKIERMRSNMSPGTIHFLKGLASGIIFTNMYKADSNLFMKSVVETYQEDPKKFIKNIAAVVGIKFKEVKEGEEHNVSED